MIPPSVIQELNRVTYCNGKDSLYLSQDNLDNFRFDIRDFHDTNYFRDSIIPVFQENKFVILSSDKNSEAKDLLFNLKQYFGEVIVQQYGKTTNGLFKIEVSEKGLTTAKTNKAQPIHTDHSFGFGFPNVVAMYCEESALRGGYTKLVRAQNVYSYLEANSQVDLENNLVDM